MRWRDQEPLVLGLQCLRCRIDWRSFSPGQAGNPLTDQALEPLPFYF